MYKKKEGIVFLAAFFAMLTLPMVFANRKDGTISVTENRTLASRAQLYGADGQLNTNYLQDLETWYNDNAGFRASLLTLDADIQYKVFDRIRDMPLGAHGELAPYNWLEDLQHKNLYTEEHVQEITDAYNVVADYLQAQGIQTYYMQCWDKQTIYPEQYPDNIEVFGDTSRTDQVEQALIQNSDFWMVPIKDRLISLKDQYTLYGEWDDPWHWTQRGALTGYQFLMEEINAHNDNRYKVLTDDDFNITETDQGMTFYNNIHQTQMLENFEFKDQKADSTWDTDSVYVPVGGNPLHNDIYTNNTVDNDDTVLILGDSYIHDVKIFYYLAESFHKTVMFNFVSVDGDQLMQTIDTYKPDIVIFENAERSTQDSFEEIIRIADRLRMRNVAPGTELSLRAEASAEEGAAPVSPAQAFIVYGMSKAEEDGTWTDGDHETFFLGMEEAEEGQQMTGSIGLAEVYKGDQNVTVSVGDQEVYSGNPGKEGLSEITFDFIMPKAKTLTVTISTPDASSPFEDGIRRDKRKLALKLTGLTIDIKH